MIAGNGGRTPLPEALPRVKVVHDIDEADKICTCGCRLTRIGEEVSEQLDIISARMQVIQHIRPKYACKKCEDVEDDGPTVKIATVPPRIIPRSIATPGLLAHILTAKFVDHTPFHRQEKQLQRLGVEISRTSMCSWAMQVALSSQPLLNLLTDELLSGFLIQADETTVQVLLEPGRDPTTKSYMWIFRRGDPEKTVLVYRDTIQPEAVVPQRQFCAILKAACRRTAIRVMIFLIVMKISVISAAGLMPGAISWMWSKPKVKTARVAVVAGPLSYIRKWYKIEKEAR